MKLQNLILSKPLKIIKWAKLIFGISPCTLSACLLLINLLNLLSKLAPTSTHNWTKRWKNYSHRLNFVIFLTAGHLANASAPAWTSDCGRETFLSQSKKCGVRKSRGKKGKDSGPKTSCSTITSYRNISVSSIREVQGCREQTGLSTCLSHALPSPPPPSSPPLGSKSPGTAPENPSSLLPPPRHSGPRHFYGSHKLPSYCSKGSFQSSCCWLWAIWPPGPSPGPFRQIVKVRERKYTVGNTLSLNYWGKLWAQSWTLAL